MKSLISFALSLAIIAAGCGTPSSNTSKRGLALGTQSAAITLTTGNNNDVNIAPNGNTTTVIRLTANASGSTLTGMSAATVSGGDLFIVQNEAAAGNLTIVNESSSSVAAYRFLTPGAANVVLPPKGAAIVLYDSSASRWRASVAPVSPAFVTDVTIGSTGHFLASSSSTPVLSSCGTSPSIVTNSTDVAGKFTTGSGATTCTITFATTWGTAPSCIVAPEGSATQPTYTTSATAITISVDIASTTYNYICIGR